MAKGRLTAEEQRLRMERIRVWMAEGRTDEYMAKQEDIHHRTVKKYKKWVREKIIGDYDGKKVLDLYVAHKKRMESIIADCYAKLNGGMASDISEEKLYRAIQQASESIIDFGLKIGIVPSQPQQLALDMKVSREDDRLRLLLERNRAELEAEHRERLTETPD
jgi:hypothetical protein